MNSRVAIAGFSIACALLTKSSKSQAGANLPLKTIVEAARKHYLEKYTASISEYREKYDPASPEVLLEMRKDIPNAYRLYRIDLASGAVDPPNLTDVNPETHLKFDPISFDYDGISVFVNPIAWNGVEFEVSPSMSDDSALQTWALRWIDASENSESDNYGLGNYVHSVTVPETSGGITSFSVDFGSARFASWSELLSALKSMGAKRITVHSRTVIGE